MKDEYVVKLFDTTKTEERNEFANQLFDQLVKICAQAAPFEWRDNFESAIEIRLPVPKKVVKKLKAFRKLMETSNEGYDFNETLGRFFAHNIVGGLWEQLKRMDAGEGRGEE